VGAIYKRGAVFWIKYYRDGKPYRESTKSDKETVAKQKLKLREGEIAAGKIPGIIFDKVKFNSLVEDFLQDYRITEKKSLARAERSVNHLKESFEGMKVVNITSPAINSYIEKRIEEGAENGTINRELAALKRMLNLGAQQTPPKVNRVPHITMLKENNVRQGFFEADEFQRLRNNLPDYLKSFVTFGYKTGWRYSEITGLKWAQVDLKEHKAWLEAGTTKNDEARTVYLDGELQTIFNDLWESRKTAMKETQKISPHVFLNETRQDRIRDIRGSWKAACTKAKIGERLFHDFRRTAIRNMVRAGVPETVAMRVSGHKTRSVFERYNIVSDTDLILAAQKQETYLRAQSGTISGTVTPIDQNMKEQANG